MNIEKQFDNLKTWAEQKGIFLIEGEYEQNKSAIVEIPNNDDKSLEIFQKLIETLGVNIIVYDTLIFDTETFKIYESAIDKVEDEGIQNKFDRLRNLENKYFGYTLLIFNQGMAFRFGNYIKETNDYLEIQSAALDYIQENNSEDSKFKELPQEKIVEFGRQLAEHDNYYKLKNRTQRENFTRELFNLQLEQLSVHSSYGASLIVSHAETFYETKIKLQKEKELKLKITELINKGWTKVKIAAELNISKDTLNKYV